MSKRMSRRSFLLSAAAGAAAPMILPRLSMAQSANGKLQHACVGVGGMGKSDMMAILGSKKAEVVAICDIDATRLAEAAQVVPNARQYRDWRVMLEKEEKNIESVNVSTPDHMHAPVAMSAIQLGKNVYCQKPLTHEVYEARQLTLAAREKGVVTQMGNQIHSHEHYRMGAQLIRDGVLGKIIEWHSWSSAPGWPQGMARPAGEDEIPESVKWDLWLGVAPARPFKTDTYHAFKWRGWKDFGGGAIGDFACHIFDPVFMGVDPGPVLKIRAEVEGVYDETWPKWEIISYEFGGSKMTKNDTVKAVWYDGGKKPPVELAQMPADKTLPGSGSLVIGEEGTMVLPHWDTPQLYPADKYVDFKKPDMGAQICHYRSWVEACLGEGKNTDHFDYAGPLTEAALLGNIANQFPNETLQWDAAKLVFPENEAATQRVRRTYRDGWDIKGLS